MYALRDVTIKNADGSVETIDTTDSHPFYVQGQGWVSADDLTAGETLSTPDGQTATVVGTTTVAEPQGVLVYNFTVADDHTYFVEGFGSNGTTGSAAAPLDAVWVHNDCDFAGHHGIPKFLGGDEEQEMYGVESALHTGQGSFHEILRQALKDEGFPPVGGTEGSILKWEQFFEERPGAQTKAFQVLYDVAKNYDFENQTQYLEYAFRNFEAGNFEVFP